MNDFAIFALNSGPLAAPSPAAIFGSWNSRQQDQPIRTEVSMANLITGNDGSNTLQGTAGVDVIYGYNPDGPQSDASTIAATRVASGLDQPLFAGAAPGDPGRLFIVEKTGLIKILDLNSGQVLATPFLDVSGQIMTDGERGLLGLAFDPNYASNGLFYVDLINTSGNTEIRSYSRIGESERRGRGERHADHHHPAAGREQRSEERRVGQSG